MLKFIKVISMRKNPWLAKIDYEVNWFLSRKGSLTIHCRSCWIENPRFDVIPNDGINARSNALKDYYSELKALIKYKKENQYFSKEISIGQLIQLSKFEKFSSRNNAKDFVKKVTDNCKKYSREDILEEIEWANSLPDIPKWKQVSSLKLCSDMSFNQVISFFHKNEIDNCYGQNSYLLFFKNEEEFEAIKVMIENLHKKESQGYELKEMPLSEIRLMEVLQKYEKSLDKLIKNS